MQTLEVTDEQHAIIQQLRASISDHVVGKYGHVREQDAVQFLLDNLDDDIDLDADGEGADATDLVGAVSAGIDAETDRGDLEAVTYDEDDSLADGRTDARETPAKNDETDASSTGDGGDGNVGDDESDDTDAPGGETAAGGSADDDDMLDEMMSLLETHDDKWEESASADYRYTVTLPDGSTEDVQTKDDVRALLFKNYR